VSEGWSEEELKILRGLYDSNIRHSDRWIGKVYDKLKKLGLGERTLTLITSDHGEDLGEHGTVGHGGLPWDTRIHVPLIVVYPPRIPAGLQMHVMSEAVDIMPTILDAAGVPIPEGKSVDGQSLLTVIREPRKGKHRVFTPASIRTAGIKYMADTEQVCNLEANAGRKEKMIRWPQMRRWFKPRLENFLEPYKTRYENAVREGPPPEPFYFPVFAFTTTPEEACERFSSGRRSVDFHALIHPARPWALNRHSFKFGLFWLPSGTAPPPITLSAEMPDGEYWIWALAQLPGKQFETPQGSGFRFRFDPKEPFAAPREISWLETEERPLYCYLDLGKARVADKRFSLQISIQPPANEPYVIKHIRFMSGEHGEEDMKAPDREDFKKKTEELKALGYL
jgi:hypothetical protein